MGISSTGLGLSFSSDDPSFQSYVDTHAKSLIEHLGLSQWFARLTPDEKAFVESLYPKLQERNILESNERAGWFLSQLARRSLDCQRFELFPKFSNDAIRYCGQTNLDRHFLFEQFSEMLYKYRNLDFVYNFIVVLCETDVELFPQYRAELVEWSRSMLFFEQLGESSEGLSEAEILHWRGNHIKTFKYLTLLYSAREKTQDLLRICELAMRYNLEDGTVSGYEGL